MAKRRMYSVFPCARPSIIGPTPARGFTRKSRAAWPDSSSGGPNLAGARTELGLIWSFATSLVDALQNRNNSSWSRQQLDALTASVGRFNAYPIACQNEEISNHEWTRMNTNQDKAGISSSCSFASIRGWLLCQ